MPRLDRSREYSEIVGKPISPIIEQDGHFFLSNGQLVDSDGRPLDNPMEEPIPYSENEPKTYEEMHWKQLSVLCKQFGREEWTNRDEAIAFLRGK